MSMVVALGVKCVVPSTVQSTLGEKVILMQSCNLDDGEIGRS